MDITPEILLSAYAAGLFPMAPDRASGELEWFRPSLRGILPLDGFHLSKRLARRVFSGVFTVTSNTVFSEVMQGCAEAAPGRETTWISGRIENLYEALFEKGHAHSIEVWSGTELVGGLYGVSLGGAFFGESMFSRQTDASKVALVHLVAVLKMQGFSLLDTQYGTQHLAQFGGIEIAASVYAGLLERAVAQRVRWVSAEVGLAAVAEGVRSLAARGRADSALLPCRGRDKGG